jgi:hypothetical protein
VHEDRRSAIDSEENGKVKDRERRGLKKDKYG